MNKIWTIHQIERKSDDGFVVNVHWRYAFAETPEDGGRQYYADSYGVVAQEIEALFPEMVQTRDNGYKTVKYDRLIPVMIEAIKELSKEIKELKGGKK